MLGAAKSGKTSLFDVIAGKRSKEGNQHFYCLWSFMLIIVPSGELKGRVTFGAASDSGNHHIAYIPQGDSHVSALTVKETLWFAARLQMPEHYSTFLFGIFLFILYAAFKKV